MSELDAEIAPSVDTRAKVGGPDALTLTVCHSCWRTDRWQKLTARHYAPGGGGLCPGPVGEVVYTRIPPASTEEADRG
jgi:hypothetical protein